jgi:hypothetical protein
LITEKPDTCVRHLLDGKIAVIIAEMPYALIFPIVFGDFFKSSEDYAGSFFSNSFFRILRYISLMLTIALPGLYISVTTFHPEMLPYDLAIRIAAARSGVPFPVFVEAVIMSLSFFTLLQASIMISQSVGSAISIVGGLVLGQAAIGAGFVSPGIIVVIAAAAISSLAIPNKDLSTISWLFQMMCVIFCGIIGLAGVVLTYLIVLYMLARLEIFGIPYISPFANTKELELDDSFVKLPDNANKMRPRYLNPKNKRRMP